MSDICGKDITTEQRAELRSDALNHTFLNRRKIMNPIKTWLADETGMELSEYAVAAALITLAIIAAFTNLGTAIVERLVDLKGKVKP